MTPEVEECLRIFFNKTIEDSINDQMMEYSYVFPYEKLEEYVTMLCSISFADYLEYIKQNISSPKIKPDDVTQISSFRSCEIDFCDKLASVRRPLTNIDIGVILQNDGRIREDGANKKYGENHAKGALQLGLAQNRYGYWYLSCLGKLYPSLDIETRNALIARTILRNNLYSVILSNLYYQDVFVDDIWDSAKLKDKTKLRRRSSVRTFLQKSIHQAYFEGFVYSYKLDFSLGNKMDIVNLVPNGCVEESAICYYKQFVDRVFNCGESDHHIIAVMVLLKATIDYIIHYPSFHSTTIKISLMLTWEGKFLKMLPPQLAKKRRSTLFSAPFIILTKMSFWRALDSNGKVAVFKGYPSKSFVHLCDECNYIEIDKELKDIIFNKKNREELINYINTATHKHYPTVYLPN